MSFDSFSKSVSVAVGKSWAFITAIVLMVIWGASGPWFHWSDTWQLICNTGTTIITFLMVFVIQSSQNRDSIAIQIKLDELIRATEARNSFAEIDTLPESEIRKLRGE